MITVTKPLSERSAAALGLFDGVHLGHRKVLEAAAACRAEGLLPAAFTFDTENFPAKHGAPFAYICTESQKRRLLEKCGIEAVYSPDFSEIQEMDGECFCREILVKTLRVKKVFCGRDFRFGRKAGWGFDDLRRFGEEMGFEAVLMDAVSSGGSTVSSTRIRSFLKNGQPEKAAELLGRPYAVSGEVIHGKALGRTICFPTINLPFQKGQLVPRFGVYLSRTKTAAGTYYGVTNIGVKPTVSDEQIPLAETHLLDFTGDLYGQECTSELLRFLRPEQKFENITALRQAISQDCETARRLAESIEREENLMEKRIRTRFAPSPTGYMHIGNLRTALYAYLIAKKQDGDFILRIEDTDQERYVEGAVDVIYNTLRIAGLNWDEGPDIGGPVGPYVQSERMGMFKSYAEELVKRGNAYYCFCDKCRLDAVRKAQEEAHMDPMYDRHCRDLSAEEVQAKLAAGAPYVIRQKMPLEGTTTFHDEIYGDISVENSTLDDQVLIKTDGMPTYNFANVVDDHLMGITHIVRGNEYLSSAPKYNLLYEAFGWDVPVYIHCAPVMKDQQHKLSKRNGDASFQDLMAKGYLPEAVINYICLLGWAPTGEQEIYSIDELKEAFTISGISKSPAIFDSMKLKAINAKYVAKLSPEQYAEIAVPYIKEAVKSEVADMGLLCHVLQPRTEIFTDIAEQVDFIDALPEYDLEMYRHKKMKTTPETALEALQKVLPVLEALEDWTADSIHGAVFGLIEQLGVKNGWMLWPIRTAVSGKQCTPGGGIELCAILGKEETLSRIRTGIERLS